MTQSSTASAFARWGSGSFLAIHPRFHRDARQEVEGPILSPIAAMFTDQDAAEARVFYGHWLLEQRDARAGVLCSHKTNSAACLCHDDHIAAAGKYRLTAPLFASLIQQLTRSTVARATTSAGKMMSA